MSWTYAGLGIIMWIIAFFTDTTGYLFEIKETNAYTGIFILFGICYFFMAIVGPSKPTQ